MTNSVTAKITPNREYKARGPMLKPRDMSVVDIFQEFGASGPDACAQITILKPFTVFSSKAYSTPATLPIGPAYLAAFLREAGHNVNIIDALGEDIKKVRTSECGTYSFQGLTTEDIIKRIDPKTEILGVSVMFSQSWPAHRDLIKEIKKNRPTLTIIAGGEHATALPEFSLNDCPQIDYIVLGEGEVTLLELVYRLTLKLPIDEVPGVAYRARSGDVCITGLSQRIKDIENIPRPAWDLCPVQNYFSGMWSSGIGYGRNMPILATRGCPYECTFCSNPAMWTQRYLMRPASDVVDEIEWLVREYGCNSVDFADLTAIVKRGWALEFCAEIKKRELNLVWQLPSGTRSEALDQDVVTALYDSGCKFLMYAPESGSERTLQLIKKKIRPKSLIKSMRGAIKVGHSVKVALIIGFPHEKRGDIFRTLLLAVRCAILGVGDCNISPYSPYPGSELFEELRSKGRISKLDDDYFRTLLGQFDLFTIDNYCENVSGTEIAMYRILGMSLFYLLSLVRQPARIVRLVRISFVRNPQANSLFEQRLLDIRGRKQLRKEV